MLVLSRRPEEKVLFPTLGISIEILRVTGQVVRVGVLAPREVPVIRAELTPPGSMTVRAARGLDHQIRGRLNTAMMAMYVAQKQLEMGQNAGAETTLQEALAELDRLEKEVAAQNSSGTPQSSARRISALLVEDNANESALLLSYLQMSGVDVARASDGADALDYLREHALPDVVLMDMRMPRCDGPTAVTAIRANPAYAGLKIYAVTGAAPGEYDLPASRGLDGWFTKPLNPAKIVETLTQTIRAA